MHRRHTRADTIDVQRSCAARYCPDRDPACTRVCSMAANVINQSFAFSPALAAVHSRIDMDGPASLCDEDFVAGPL